MDSEYINFNILNFSGLSKRALKTLLGNYLDRRWLENYLRLKLFCETFERFPNQKEEHPKGMRIGSWAHRQKLLYRFGKLSHWRVKLLLALGIDWGRNRVGWEDMYDMAVTLQQKKGAPLSRYGTTEEERLCKQWLYTQAEKIKEGSLPENKVSKLFNAGLIVDRIEYRWNESYGKVVKFIGDNGRLPSAHSLDNHEERLLGKWRLNQVERMNHGKLSRSQMNKMTKAGLTEKIIEIEWNEKFRKTSRIINEQLKKGRIVGENGIREQLGDTLCVWWRDQRRKYRNGQLSEEQKRKVEAARLHKRLVDLQRHC